MKFSEDCSEAAVLVCSLIGLKRFGKRKGVPLAAMVIIF